MIYNSYHSSLLEQIKIASKGCYGFTNGCFDILHRGHVEYLQECKNRCTYLIVGVNTDDSVKLLKGKNRPINIFSDRCHVLTALRSVDLVIGFSDATPRELIQNLKPKYLFKGADYKIEDVVGSDVVKAYGGSVELIDFRPNYSSTNIIRKIKEIE